MDRAERVLVVYADRARARTVATSLRRADDRLRADTATSNRAAARTIESDEYDCVVAGCELPESDGIELLRSLRLDKPGLPFVFYPETPNETVVNEAIGADATEYVHPRPSVDQSDMVVSRIHNVVHIGREDRTATRQRRRLDKILSTVPSCVVELDLDGNFVFANERAEEVLGLDKEALTERRYNDPEWELRDLTGKPIPDADLPFSRVVDSKSLVRNLRHKIAWPDGTERVLSVSGAPLFDDGELDGVVCSLTDVTEQQRREQRLEELHAATRGLSSATTADEVARIGSEAATTVLGFEMNGVHLFDASEGGLAPTAVSDTARERTDELATFDHGIAWETYQDGEVRAYGDIREADEVFDPDTDVESGLYFPLGQHGVLVVSSETTENFDDADLSLGKILAANVTAALDRVARERMLASLQRQTKALMNSSTEAETADLAVEAAEEIIDAGISGFFDLDEDGTRLERVSVTDRMESVLPEHFGPDDGPVPSFLWSVVEQDDPVTLLDARADGEFPEDCPVRSVLAYPARDGIFVVATDEEPALDDTDAGLCSILVGALDAALQRVQREALLRERTQRLAEQNEQLDQFASVVAHDLRNPLQVLRGVLDTAVVDDEPADRGTEALNRMEGIINDVLTLAREGTSIDSPEPVSLSSLAHSSWTVVDGADASLVVESECRLVADAGRLRQLLENLYANAVSHGSPGVAVTVGGTPDGFYVADDGPGVSPTEQDRIFESGYSGTENGTGFGLAIVSQIAKAHGWTVTATDSAEGGLRVEFAGVETAD